MIDDSELDAAVAAGIVTQDQAEALRRFVVSCQPRIDAERVDDERFRFLSGFNDIFFAVGIALFAIGLSFFANVVPFGHFVAAAIIWVLSEFVVRRQRLVLPGILLACIFAYFATRFVDKEWIAIARNFGFPDWLAPTKGFPPYLDTISYPPLIAAKGLVTAVAASLFYVRFRLPFALLLIAAGSVVFVLLRVWIYATNSGTVLVSLMLLVCGLVVFGAAMTYDLADRDRVTRRADCAFWLHLLAAPLIVHSLIQLSAPTFAFKELASSMTAGTIATIVGVIAVLTIVALLIDRRALFVSALSYLGIVIGYTIRTAGGTSNDSLISAIFATLLILGVMVLALGFSWQPLRRMLVSVLPATFIDRLPRVAPV